MGVFRLNHQAGFLAYGSTRALRLPICCYRLNGNNGQWLIAAPVPDYSNGWLAMDSHHLSL